MAKKNYNKGKDDFKKDGKPTNKAYTMKGKSLHSNIGDTVYDKRTPDGLDAHPSNDISYYNQDNEALIQASNIPWAVIYGTNIPWTSLVPGANVTDIHKPVGIVRSEFYYGPGYSASVTSPINRCYSRIMSNIYAKTKSTTLPFTQAQLAFIQTCANSIAINIATVKRIMKATRFLTVRNQYYWKVLVNAMGSVFTDVISNFDSYRQRLNVAIDDFNTLCILSTNDIIHREYSLASNVYIDEDSDLGQIYFWTPAGYYVYRDNGPDTHPEYAEWIEFQDTPSVNDLLSIITNQISALRNSAGFYYVSGTLLRAYPESKYFYITRLTDSEAIVPICDRVMSLQMMNSNVVGKVDNMDVTEDVLRNNVFWRPRPADADEINIDKVMLRAYDRRLTNEDVVEMTRLIAKPSKVIENAEEIAELVDCNPEFIRKIVCYTMRQDGSIYSWPVMKSHYIIDGEFPDFAWLPLMNFRYIPTTYIGTTNTLGQSNNWVLGDTYNYTFVGVKDLNVLNSICAYSLYKVADSTPISINA